MSPLADACFCRLGGWASGCAQTDVSSKAVDHHEYVHVGVLLFPAQWPQEIAKVRVVGAGAVPRASNGSLDGSAVGLALSAFPDELSNLCSHSRPIRSYRLEVS